MTQAGNLFNRCDDAAAAPVAICMAELEDILSLLGPCWDPMLPIRPQPSKIGVRTSYGPAVGLILLSTLVFLSPIVAIAG